MIIDSVFNVKFKQRTLNTSKERIRRSLAKTVSWRVIGTIDTVLISWIVTGTAALALSIGAIELISKMILYFFHERVWNIIK